MEVSYAFLPNSAELGESELPVNVDAGSNHGDLTSVPARLSDSVLVVKLAASSDERDQEHNLRVRLWDHAGHTIAVWSEPFAFPRQPAVTPGSASVVTGFQLDGIPCANADDYQFEIYVDEQHLRSVPLSSGASGPS